MFALEENYSSQNIIIEGRKRLEISGIKDVISFDEETLLLDSVMGRITVKGEGLHIESFNTQSGDLTAAGKIHAAVYMSDAKAQGGLLSKLFR